MIKSKATGEVILVAAMVFGAGCQDPTSPLESPEQTSFLASVDKEGGESDGGELDCENEVLFNPECRYGGGKIGSFFSDEGDELRSAPNDPFPSQPGIWLGANTTAETCFAATGRTIADRDKDWLDDGCEYRIARAFAPTMIFHYADQCADGEPYWAAKYFPKSDVVRIAYMPAYYEDCGTDKALVEDIEAHTGDAEFVHVEVRFHSATGHWWFLRMWLSAHYGSEFPGFILGEDRGPDRSELVPHTETYFSQHFLSHPTIWVAKSKHANYKSAEACLQHLRLFWGLMDGDDICPSSHLGPLSGNLRIRFPVTPSTNVGSRFVGTECVYSTKRYVGSGRAECFYYDASRRISPLRGVTGNWDGPIGYGSFRGWQDSWSGTTPPPYRDYLMSDRYEYKLGDGWGPGPDLPTLTAAIDGPGSVTEYTEGTWRAAVSQGYPPYSYRWYVGRTLTPVGTSPTITRRAGPNGSVIDLRLEVTDAEGERAWAGTRVRVVSPSRDRRDDEYTTIRE